MAASGKGGRNGVGGVIGLANQRGSVEKRDIRDAAVGVTRSGGDVESCWRGEGSAVGGRRQGDCWWQIR